MFKLRDSTGSGGYASNTFTITIEETAVSGNNTSGTFSPTAADLLDTEAAIEGAPTGSRAAISYLATFAAAQVFPGVNVKLKKMRALGLIP